MNKEMKKIILMTACLWSGAMLFSSCSDRLRIGLDIVDADTYVNIYMPQANNDLNVKTVYITDEIQSFAVSAFYGGPTEPQTDISVEFEIRMDLVDSYNTFHGTDYKPMPEGSYSMSETTARIAKGAQRTTPLYVDITSKDYLAVAEPYLLPVGIKSVSGTEPVLEELRTAYFLVTGSYMPGEVPREKVYSFGHPVTMPIFCSRDDLVRIDEDGRLMLFQPEPDGTYGAPRQIGEGWGNMQIMFYMPENRFIVRNEFSNLTQYMISDNYDFLSQGDIGWGWGESSKIVPFKDLAILAVNGDALWKYPLSQTGAFDFGNCTAIEGSGWGGYTQLFGYGNNLIMVDPKGDMWVVSLTDDYALGTKRQIGTGWDMYDNVFACGDDLLALDSNGDLWRYEIEPLDLWALKAAETAGVEGFEGGPRGAAGGGRGSE